MARPKNTELRRNEIVQALLTVMADQGYAKATIQAIAKAADLRPGLIHYHFKTKQDILIELVKQVIKMGEDRYLAELKEDSTPGEKLKAFVNARLAKGQGEIPQAVAAWVVIGTEAIRQPEVRIEYEKGIASQRKTLEDLLKASTKGKIGIAEIRQVAAVTIAAMEGAFQLSVAAKDVMPKGYAAAGILTLLERYC